MDKNRQIISELQSFFSQNNLSPQCHVVFFKIFDFPEYAMTLD